MKFSNKKIKLLFFSTLLCSIAIPVQAGSIEPRLQQEMVNRSSSADVDIIVRFRNRVDAEAYTEQNKVLQRSKIVKAMKEQAFFDEKVFKALWKGVKPKKERSLWLINGLALTVPAYTVETISALAGVESVSYDRKIILTGHTVTGASAPIKWNLDRIRAQELWLQGYTGTGIVVGTLDSGADLSHPDVGSRWRGGTNSWFDPNGEHATPFDKDGHGTQVLGIIVGGDAGNIAIGVAPGAHWIAAKIFNDLGMASLSSIHAGFQWMLDPDDNPATNDAPDIVNNSWDLANTENVCDGEFSPDIATLKAAGIAVVFSAGNSGPAADTSLSPSDDAQSFAVGSIDISNTIANTSGRGPSDCTGGIFPHLVAPGVEISTADLNFGLPFPFFVDVSGTSFAAPHVSGGLALLKQAFPNASVSQLEQSLTASALDLGAAGADNVYGHGLLELVAAHDWLAANTGGLIPGDFEFAQAVYSVAETGGSLTVTVNRVNGSAGTTTVDYATADNTALAGLDYQTAIGTLTFLDGETSKTFSLAIIDDSLVEGDEIFDLSLANATGGAALGLNSLATATIVDNDTQNSENSVQFSAATYSALEDSEEVLIMVTRTSPADGQYIVDYSITAGTATAGVDFKVKSGELEFDDGETTKSFKVKLLKDHLYEVDETVILTLSVPSLGLQVGTPNPAVLTIIDDDKPGAFSFSYADYSADEDESKVEILVLRNGGSDGEVTVDYAISAGTATPGQDFIASSGTLTFEHGEREGNIKLKLIKDKVLENDETINLSLSSATGGATLGSLDQAIVTIIDND